MKLSFGKLFMYAVTIVFFVGITYSMFFNPKTRLINKPVVTDTTQVIADTAEVVIDSVKTK